MTVDTIRGPDRGYEFLNSNEISLAYAVTLIAFYELQLVRLS
jgi:hypothetical protein